MTNLFEIIDALDAYAVTPPGPAAASAGQPKQAAAAQERAQRERRAHIRVRPGELDRRMIARLKYGPALTLLDLSAGGALIQTPTRIHPGTRLVLELVSADAQQIVIPTRIIRAEVASLAGGLQYRGGCEFKDLLQVPGLGLPRMSEAVTAPQAAAALQQLRQEKDGRQAGADPVVSDLLDEVMALARGGRPPRALMAHVEDRLRRRVPLLTVGIGNAARGVAAGGNAIAFEPSSPDGSRLCRVEFQPACRLDEAQVRLLEAGASLIALLHAGRQLASPLAV